MTPTLRCILSCVREELDSVATLINDAELARHVGNAARDLAEGGVGKVPESAGANIYSPLVSEVVSRVRRGERA